MILHWTSRVTRCLFWVCFHLVSRTHSELCYSNLFMFKCHLSGPVKEALVVGVHIGWKLRTSHSLVEAVFRSVCRAERTSETIKRLYMMISNEIWLWMVWRTERRRRSSRYLPRLSTGVRCLSIQTEECSRRRRKDGIPAQLLFIQEQLLSHCV